MFQANLGIASLITLKMVKEGTALEEARSKIFMMDSRGLIVTSRPNLSGHKLHFAKVYYSLIFYVVLLYYTVQFSLFGRAIKQRNLIRP